MIFLASRLLEKDHHEEAHHAADFLAAVALGEFVDVRRLDEFFAIATEPAADVL